MIKKVRKHLNSSYLFLPIALLFVGLILYFQNYPKLQLQLVVLAAISYIVVALVHHYHEKSLTIEVIIEYALIAALAIILLSGFLI
jgi:hypothetical protein